MSLKDLRLIYLKLKGCETQVLGYVHMYNVNSIASTRGFADVH